MICARQQSRPASQSFRYGRRRARFVVVAVNDQRNAPPQNGECDGRRMMLLPPWDKCGLISHPPDRRGVVSGPSSPTVMFPIPTGEAECR